MQSPLTIPLDEVGALLGRSPDAVKRRYRALLASGFPRRLPGSDWRFSRALVRAWVNAQSAPAIAANDDLTIVIGPEQLGSLAALHHELLSRKYGGERA